MFNKEDLQLIQSGLTLKIGSLNELLDVKLPADRKKILNRKLRDTKRLDRMFKRKLGDYRE